MLLSPQNALTFILAGNATVTFRSLKTDKHLTFKVKRSKKNKDIHHVTVLTGTNNDEDYSYIGYIKANRFYTTGKAETSKGIAEFAYVFNALNISSPKLNQVEIMHSNKCGRCGRTLTRPESILTGIGPECISKR